MAKQKEFALQSYRKPFAWFDQVYRFDFLLFTCPFEQMRAWIQKQTKEDITRPNPSSWASTHWLRNEGAVSFWFDASVYAPVAAWQGLITHECCHAANYVLFGLGMEHTIESDEAYAYYMGWLAEEINMRIRLKAKT